MRRTMNKRSRILHTCASILALTLLLSGSSPAQTSTPLPTTAPDKPPSATAGTAASSAAAGSSKETCLRCHGPFDKLVSASANYTMPSGEKTSPHRYVPHNSKDIPECSNCHKRHPVPLTSTEGLPKPNPEWCYTCHHAGVLQCGTCHQ